MYKKIIITLIVIMQSGCAIYTEPQGSQSTLAIVKGSHFKKSDGDLGNTGIAQVDGKEAIIWGAEKPTKIAPGNHRLRIESTIHDHNHGFLSIDRYEAEIAVTFKAGNEYQIFGDYMNKKINYSIVDQNNKKVVFTLIEAKAIKPIPVFITV